MLCLAKSTAGVIDLTIDDSSTSSTKTDMVSTPNLRGSRNASTSTQVVTPSPNRGTSRRRRDPDDINDIIARTERRIRHSPHFGFNPTLAEYLIRILKQVLEGDIIPISVLMCPHPHMDLACGGRGCDNDHFCPTAEILKIFSEALPNHRIEFANPGQPIDNMMVINGRESCVGDDCEGNLKTPMPSESPTPKPTCKPIGRVEGQSTAELINLFAEGVRNLGAHVFIVNHGGWGMYQHFFRYLNRALFVAVCAYGVHISLYQRRRLAFGRWRTPDMQGYRISQYVKQHSDVIGDVYAQYGTPLVVSIFEYLLMRNVRFVHRNFLTATIQQAYQRSVRSTRRVYHRLPGFRDYQVARWNYMFDQLREFHRQHGHTIVPQDYRIQGSPLGRWVMTQREQRLLTSERRSLLNSIDFCWNAQVARWNETFAQLKAFKARHGHTNVPLKSSPLGRWVGNQRSRCTDEERRALLDSIGFDWNPPLGVPPRRS